MAATAIHINYCILPLLISEGAITDIKELFNSIRRANKSRMSVKQSKKFFFLRKMKWKIGIIMMNGRDIRRGINEERKKKLNIYLFIIFFLYHSLLNFVLSLALPCQRAINVLVNKIWNSVWSAYAYSINSL